MAEVYATTPQVTSERRTIKGPPGPERVKIYAKDGTMLDVFPVDAREIVAGGEYFYEPPAPVETAVESNVSGPIVQEVLASEDSVSEEAEAPRRRGRPPKQAEEVT